MITQTFTQGKNEIKIETAESLIDMEENGFSQNECSRFYVNGKRVNSYQDLMSFIVRETAKNKNPFIPENIPDLRKKLIEDNRQSAKEFLEKIQRETKININPNEILRNVDGIMLKTDITGVRIKE